MRPFISAMMLAASGAGAIGSAPTLFASDLHLVDSVSSQVVTWPASLAVNDIGHLFVHVTHPSALPTITDPAGWTLIESILSPDGLTATKHYWKRLAGTETGTFTVSLSGGTSTGVMHTDLTIWRGCKTSGTPFENNCHRCEAARAMHSGHDITTLGPNRRVMTVFGVSRTNTTGTPAGSWTQDWQQNWAGGLGANGSGQSIAQAAAGYVAGVQVTVGTSSISTSVTLAWIPANDTAGAGSGPSISVRGSRITWVNNANTIAFSLPTGSLAGDQCVIFLGHGWNVSATPTGWVAADAQAGSNVNGYTYEKVLSAADIATGSVTINFAGTYYGVVAGITFVGTTAGMRTIKPQRDSTGATTRNITTATSPVTNDYVGYFGFGRFNGTVTCNLGSALQTTTNNEGSAVLTGGLLGSSGAVSPTFTFSAAPTGDYVVAIDFVP